MAGERRVDSLWWSESGEMGQGAFKGKKKKKMNLFKLSSFTFSLLITLYGAYDTDDMQDDFIYVNSIILINYYVVWLCIKK